VATVGDGPTGDAPGDTITWRSLWAETTRTVGDRIRARWLCETAAGCDPDEFLDELDHPVTERMVAHLDAMLARLRVGEPLQYVLGSWGFRHLTVMLDRRVLIPRPETEMLVDVALAALVGRPRPWRVVDLGTGSGAIGLSIAFEADHDGLDVWLADVSVDALDVARANLAGIGRAARNVRVASGSWYEALPTELAGTFDLIVSNPPYIAEHDPDLEPIVRDWEPPTALFAGDGGSAALSAIATDAPRWLAPGGVLAVEIGSRLDTSTVDAFTRAGLVDVAVHADAAGLPRIVVGRRSTSP
jgi:release factor glutamine methyltransferase